MDFPDDDLLGDLMTENEVDEEDDPFLKFIDNAKSILYENVEEEDPTRFPGWSWIATRILRTCVAYSSGVTPAILHSELSLV